MTTKRGRLIAGVAAVAIVGTAGVVMATRGDHRAPPRGSTAAAAEATPSSSANDAAQAIRKREVNVLLAQRATAVLKGDLKGFLAMVDPQQPALVTEQRTLFTNLRKLPFGKLTYFVDAERRAPDFEKKFGPTTFSVRLMMRYQLTGLDTAPVQTDLGYTFTRRDNRWVLVSDSAIDEFLSTSGHHQPWDFGEIAVVRRHRVVVVVDKAEASLGAKIAASSDAAVDAVRRHWPRPWNGAVMVVAMRDKLVMSTLWYPGVTAKAVNLYDGEPFGLKQTAPIGSRIVINPANRQHADKQLLVHEMTHVATASIGWLVPEWLDEGLAEYVRLHTIEDDPDWTVDPYREDVRSKYLPTLKTLPTQADFDTNSARAYALSWWATEYIAAKKGINGLAALYADLAVHNANPAAYESIIKRHTGRTPAALTAAIKTWHG